MANFNSYVSQLESRLSSSIARRRLSSPARIGPACDEEPGSSISSRRQTGPSRRGRCSTTGEGRRSRPESRLPTSSD